VQDVVGKTGCSWLYTPCNKNWNCSENESRRRELNFNFLRISADYAIYTVAELRSFNHDRPLPRSIRQVYCFAGGYGARLALAMALRHVRRVVTSTSDVNKPTSRSADRRAVHTIVSWLNVQSLSSNKIDGINELAVDRSRYIYIFIHQNMVAITTGKQKRTLQRTITLT